MIRRKGKLKENVAEVLVTVVVVAVVVVTQVALVVSLVVAKVWRRTTTKGEKGKIAEFTVGKKKGQKKEKVVSLGQRSVEQKPGKEKELVMRRREGVKGQRRGAIGPDKGTSKERRGGRLSPWGH